MTTTNEISVADATDMNSVWLANRLNDAKNLEDVLCLATLVSTKTLGVDANLKDAYDWFVSLSDGCDSCSHKLVCLACIINE